MVTIGWAGSQAGLVWRREDAGVMQQRILCLAGVGQGAGGL
jgi:hypothetical protein